MAAPKPAAHVRHAGLMIDASWKDGAVEFYVVEGGPGRFHTLTIAKEIAEGRAARRRINA